MLKPKRLGRRRTEKISKYPKSLEDLAKRCKALPKHKAMKTWTLNEPLMVYCPLCKRYFPQAKIGKHLAKHNPEELKKVAHQVELK